MLWASCATRDFYGCLQGFVYWECWKISEVALVVKFVLIEAVSANTAITNLNLRLMDAKKDVLEKGFDEIVYKGDPYILKSWEQNSLYEDCRTSFMNYVKPLWSTKQ